VAEAHLIMNPARSLCMVTDDFLPAATGVGIHVQTIVEIMAERGLRVSVLTSRRPGQAAVEYWCGAKIIRVPSMKLLGFHLGFPKAGLIEDIFDQEGIDLVHFHYLGWMMKTVLRVARKRKLKCVYTTHMTLGHLTPTRPLRLFLPVLEWGYRRMCRKLDLIIVPSLHLIPEIQSRTDVPVQYLNNPIRFHKSELAQTLSTKEHPFTVLFVGRLSAEKNIPFLLRAFARLHKEFQLCRLWIVGEGRELKSLTIMSRQLGISEQTVFCGQHSHEELSKFYSKSDVFVLPSLFETHGMVAVEAMRFAKPVILTDSIVSARELVTPEENGFIVTLNDDEELCAQLLRLARDRDLGERMGRRGLKRAQEYDPGQAVDRLLELYPLA